MPKRRLQIDTGALTPEAFQPAAVPVDRMRRTEAGNTLQGLAAGLAQLSPGLARFAEVRGEQEDAAAKARGEAEARRLREEGLTFKQAVERGLIDPTESPWYRLGSREFFGRNTGTQYRDWLSRELQGSSIKDSTEVADFDGWEREQRKRFVEEFVGQDNRDPAFEGAFGSTVDNAVSGIRAGFAAGAGKRLEDRTGEQVHQRIMGLAKDAHTFGITTETAARHIRLDIERALAMGVGRGDKGKVNRSAAQAVINAALETNDTDLLEILNQVETSPGNTLGTLPDVAEAVTQARKEIRRTARELAQAERQEEEIQRAENARTLGTALTTEMVTLGPLNVQNFDQRVAEIAKYDEGYARSFYGARQTVLNGMDVEDPEEVEQLVQGVYTGSTNLREALRALEAGHISVNGFNQVVNAFQMVRSLNGDRDARDDEAFKVTAFTQILSQLNQVEFSGGIEEKVSGSDNPDKRRLWAQDQLRRLWHRWYWQQGGKDKNWNEQMDFLDKTRDNLIKAAGAVVPAGYVDKPGGQAGEKIMAADLPLPAWKRRRVTSEGVLNAIERAVAQGTSGFTPAIVNELKAAGVPPSMAAIEEYIAVQRSFLSEARFEDR